MNTKQAFHKVKALTGCESRQNHSTITDPTTFPNTLNTFYTQFDIHKHSVAFEELQRALPFHKPTHPPFTLEGA